jgi:hypothetical protein
MKPNHLIAKIEKRKEMTTTTFERNSTIRFISTTIITGLVGGLLAAVMGFVTGGMVGDYLYRNMEQTLRIGLQAWVIFGATHAVFYSIRRQTGSGSYIWMIAGGFGAGLLLYLIWGYLPFGVGYGLLFILPIAGAMSGYYLSEKAKGGVAA